MLISLVVAAALGKVAGFGVGLISRPEYRFFTPGRLTQAVMAGGIAYVATLPDMPSVPLAFFSAFFIGLMIEAAMKAWMPRPAPVYIGNKVFDPPIVASNGGRIR